MKRKDIEAKLYEHAREIIALQTEVRRLNCNHVWEYRNSETSMAICRLPIYGYYKICGACGKSVRLTAKEYNAGKLTQAKKVVKELSPTPRKKK